MGEMTNLFCTEELGSFDYMDEDIRGDGEFLKTFPLQSEDCVKEMTEKEINHVPKANYLARLRCGEMELINIRQLVLNLIVRAYAYLGFGALSFCLSVNYLDRFLSMTELPDKDHSWTVKILALACISIGTKVAESFEVPSLIHLQVEEEWKIGEEIKLVFTSGSMKRMELLLLSRLDWKMQVITPYSFIDYFLTKINGGRYPSFFSIERSNHIIVNTFKAIDMLQFKPSEIAAAVAIYVSTELNVISDFSEAVEFSVKVNMEKVLTCIELIINLSLTTVNMHSPYVETYPFAACGEDVEVAPLDRMIELQFEPSPSPDKKAKLA
ncbi:hypothetical protein ACFE04_021104 [Oxalis oulophora]